VTVVELAAYALVLAVAAVAVWRRPVVVLFLFVVGLALHNAGMAALYSAGVRGSTLTAITAWKEILLVVAFARLGLTALRARELPFRWRWVDSIAIAFALLCAIYAVIPQSALGGSADSHAVALGFRHDVLPVAVYFLGRGLSLSPLDWRRLRWTLLGTAAAVAGWGLIDAYAIPISWWRTNGVVSYFRDHLGYEYHGTGGLPENFIYNVGGNEPFLRRLVSTFLSPLASGYLFIVALLVGVSRRRAAIVLAVVAGAGLLWTFSRSSLVALAAGLVVLGLLRRRAHEVGVAVAVLVVAVGWAHLFPHVAPTGDWTKKDLVYQAELAKKGPKGPFTATSSNEPSLHEHWHALKDGVHTMAHHPQGYGLGNVGQVASRTDTRPKAGESNYTELGVELGLLGSLLWIAWGVAIFAALARSRAFRLAAAFAAVAALAVQTDVIGDPWIAYCVWGLAGAGLLKTRPQERLAADPALA
jgi:O-antigen ligase/polysaccharide polymerase Wzy-like membrane protein